MKELLRTQNPAELALIKSLLQSAGIKFFVFDENISAQEGGFMTAYAPCRVMVLDDDLEKSINVLNEVNKINV
jgi:hypothetical protein